MNIFDEQQQKLWIGSLNYNNLTGSKFNNETIKIKLTDKYLTITEKVYFDELVILLRQYIKNSIPNYLASEYNYWSISCLPNYLKESNCITRININSVPVLSVFEETDGSLIFRLFVSKLPYLHYLKENSNPEKLFFEDFSALSIDLESSFEENTDGDEMSFLISQKDFQQAIKDKLFLSSIRTFNLRMMNKTGRENKFRRRVTHCLDFSDKILEY